MRLTIAAVGRLKGGPEGELVADYAARAGAAGRALGLGPVQVAEVDERKARDAEAQGARLLSMIPEGAAAVALDERGKLLDSPGLARLIADFRDAGRGETVFLIGGADGHTEALRSRADRLLSFGPMVWPHMLARAMLAEQLYRAVTILAGSPYHRS
ncbi:23S rRNA (pseudouridine(1915)-N(3))-methyltransferase RlmH [Paralimibaculum aggregatum]|uniref:Ribosomal RNA large subunit methyltransferase H n=1 Tax=Paralimibaculum aggregatum TaxID=3036245 RepID=A0ABQ6LLG1_9RHOB|nr:23S rRNA (pseudouridine(1915)-N(3))-methyltransferase RlmH [Limibaculum sp. NKW23]GMG82492.1 23S rRNA (pseudouridine(1915)-N(3))-methyltransferase RlmH [Limibaculum sp. NKW23]